MPQQVTDDRTDRDPDAVQFFEAIRSEPVDTETLAAVCERIRERHPSVGTFSFDFLEQSEGGSVREGELSPGLRVETGTPQPIVDAWNTVKVVGLFAMVDGVYCGAAIGRDVRGRDFKACVLPVEGEDCCEVSAHKDKRAVRLPAGEGGFSLRISVPTSSAERTVQVFSRPFLSSGRDLRYAPAGSPVYERLMSIKVEPRVWKFALENFPGPEVLLDPSSPAPQPSLTRSRGLVSDKPIHSPQKHITKQDDPSDGWSNNSLGSGLRSTKEEVERAQKFPWSTVFAKPASDEEESEIEGSDEDKSRVDPPRSKEDYQGQISELVTRVRGLEIEAQQREEAVVTTFNDMAQRFYELKADLKSARQTIKELKENRSRVAPPTRGGSLSGSELNELVRLVSGELSMTTDWVKRDEVSFLPTQVQWLDVEAKVDAVHLEMFNAAGSVPRLYARMDVVEASRTSTAIEMGGHVFADEMAMDGWLRTLNDPNVNRFVPDFVSLFLLAEPKYETIDKGLDQTAAAKKAHFDSLEVATIDLSYSMKYPDRILKASDKEAATDTDGMEWAAPFATHASFEGTYNNGAHQRLKKRINGVLKALEGGVDYAFPVKTHPKANAVFKAQIALSGIQCLEFLDAQSPLWKQIAGGGMSDAEAWQRNLVFAKQVFDEVATVRTTNSESSMSSKVWASFRTSELLKVYQRHNWVEHPKTSSILALTSIRKEGKALAESAAQLQSHKASIKNHDAAIKKLTEDIKELKKKNPSLA